jgi:predicted SnoaL-like aldol condensation-catalyzing enzyme
MKVIRFSFGLIMLALLVLGAQTFVEFRNHVQAASVASSPTTSTHSAQWYRETQEQRNKEVVLQAYKEFFNQGKTNLVGQFFARGFVQHDPTVAGGQQGLINQVEQNQALNPRPVTTIKHILADGSLVMVHGQISTTPNNEASGRAFMDVYRLKGGLIVEHWTSAQAVPATSANGNSMFSDLYKYQGPVPPVSEAQEEANKQLDNKAYIGVFVGQETGLLDNYWAPGNGYIQHNPNFANGVAALKAFVLKNPAGVRDIRYTVAEGDLVFTYAQVIPLGGDINSDFTGLAVSDLSRIVNGKIVEHWDVLQPVPATSVNGNSMFSSVYPEN